MTTRRTLDRVRKVVKGEAQANVLIAADDLLDLLFDAEEARGLRERVEELSQALTVIAEAMGIGVNHG